MSLRVPIIIIKHIEIPTLNFKLFGFDFLVLVLTFDF